jgi:hypothetical protein
MTKNIIKHARNDIKLANHDDRLRSRAEVESMLRDIAFVLKMTRQVRDEIEAEQGADELVLA